MKSIFTKITALLLCLAMLVTTMPLSVLAEVLDEPEIPEVIEPDTENPDGEDPDEEFPDEELPDEEEPVDIYANPVDVATADELQAALEQKILAIRITADFALDRTFYITADAAIFTEQAHTLTRAPGFGGDIFVVGESADGPRNHAGCRKNAAYF